ncbi:hypothetical protein AN478_12965 [Thiohalorhabdus denitrificans]|uniref:Tetratricopeptide repeat-containing protein n=1 Tax=Thiohalorhabdus denitrificans TaxID=381306 RepID=A0A0N8PMN0_9GAMM|nr:hypothetical protein [Thiohalorhabdus denitrificans]KPV39181.1 hypothetical protein AN478_12965 [Thiohalorhabdus denitrificans]SCX75680.1 hypothetical protein SAMN05661077_0259 [Thiohalorhabdus denitrificans]
MDLEGFKATLADDGPPEEVGRPLQALWWEAQGDWEGAHRLAQAEPNRDGAWVHAYLHRKEGDLGNAQYWYSRAARTMAGESLDREWEEIAAALLGERG